MRFIVYGAGAVGGSLGALLSGAGHEVVLIARGEHLKALRDNGLLLRTPERETLHRIPAARDVSELDWRRDDVVLLAMKSQDTEPALRDLPPDTTVVSVQNGVANERTALRYAANVYGVCVMFPTSHLEPGVVAAHSSPVPGILNLGRYPAGSKAIDGDINSTAERIAAAFRDAGFQSRALPDIMRWKYRKLLMNLGNAVEAVCGFPNSEIVRRVRAEGEYVLSVAGIPCASVQEDAALRGDTLQSQEIAGQPRSGSSSWQSLARGTGSIEADFLNGEIVLLGRLHGVPTPYNETARRLANQLARDGRPPGSVTPEEWQSNVDSSYPHATRVL